MFIRPEDLEEDEQFHKPSTQYIELISLKNKQGVTKELLDHANGEYL